MNQLPILYSNVAFIFQETFRERQGIVGPLFDLDHACNLANSELAFLIALYFLLTCYFGSGRVTPHRNGQIRDVRCNLLGKILGQVY